MKYDAAAKKDEVIKFSIKRMELESIMLSEPEEEHHTDDLFHLWY